MRRREAERPTRLVAPRARALAQARGPELPQLQAQAPAWVPVRVRVPDLARAWVPDLARVRVRLPAPGLRRIQAGSPSRPRWGQTPLRRPRRSPRLGSRGQT